MLLSDYCKIIVTGLCNSPDHLLHHYYKREVEYLKERHFNDEEIEYNLKHVLRMMKDSIRKSYEISMKDFERYKKIDESLPKEKRYYYPKPDINTIRITQLRFEHLPILNFPSGRSYLMKDFEIVENALDKVFANIEKKETLSERLTAELESKGFFELNKVNQLNVGQRQRLVDSISMAELPYKIAMLDYLSFIELLKTEHSKTYTALYKDLGKILSAKERAVKGNVLVLNPKSSENRDRYTAHKKKQVAKKDYERIKSGVAPTDCP